MSVPGFVIVSDDESGNETGTVHTAVTDESGNQRLVTLSEASNFPVPVPLAEKVKFSKPGFKHIKKKGEYKCDLCTMTFKSPFTLRHHRSRIHKDNQTNETSVMGRRYACNICGEMSPSFKTLRVHKIACHADDASINVVQAIDEPTDVSEVGGAAAENYPGLLPYEVRRRQQLEGLIITDQYQASQIAAELQILQTKTQPKRPRYVCRKEHRCSICFKNFASPSLLQRHQSVHTGDKPYSCPYCHKKYTQQEHVQRHIRWFHSGQNTRVTRSGQVVPVWFTCNVCGKQYYQKHRYVDHLRVHIEGLHRCEICNKEFAMKASLRRHLQTHSAEKNYECDLCQKRFSNSQTLHNHKRYHNKDYRYKCTFCERGFEKKARLLAHIQKHSFDMENPYECKLCWARFDSKERLSEHETLHTPGMGEPHLATSVKRAPKKKKTFIEVPNLRFQCTICFGKFKLSSDLRRHCKLYHKELKLSVEEEEEEEEDSEEATSSENKETNPQITTKMEASETPQELHEMQVEGREEEKGTAPEEPEYEGNILSTRFTCALCAKTFNSMEEIQLHMRLHESSKKSSGVLPTPNGSFQGENMGLVTHNLVTEQHMESIQVAPGTQAIMDTNSFSSAPSHHLLTPVQYEIGRSPLEAGTNHLIETRPGQPQMNTRVHELQPDQKVWVEGVGWLSSDFTVCQPVNDGVIMVPAANWPPTEQQMESGDLLLAIVSEHNRIAVGNPHGATTFGMSGVAEAQVGVQMTNPTNIEKVNYSFPEKDGGFAARDPLVEDVSVSKDRPRSV